MSYKPITVEDIKAISDHLRGMMPGPIEPIYLTQQEYDQLCIEVKPVQMNDPLAFLGHPIHIVTAEQKEAQRILKILKQQSDGAKEW